MPDVDLSPYLALIQNNQANDATPVRQALAALASASNDLDAINFSDALAGMLGVVTPSGVRRGKAIIAGAEARSSAGYATLTTPDRVQNVVVPTDGRLFVDYTALWKESVAGAGLAAIFVGPSRLKIPTTTALAPGNAAEATMNNASGGYMPLRSFAGGLVTKIHAGSGISAGDYVDGATAEVVGITDGIDYVGGACEIRVSPGTYDVSVQFAASSGSVTVKQRELRVWTIGF